MTKKYSGKQVVKAGEWLRDHSAADSPADFDAAMDILSYWRYSHEYPLEAAFKILQETALKIDKSVIFAKRLKRHPSIVGKLSRFREMQLKTMQDIGGCRVIVSDPKKIMPMVRALSKLSEFQDLDGKVRFKDYINSPKEDGYRGYHLIGLFNDENNEKKKIEIQLRTSLQHDWATALEIVDLFTGQALKSNQGDKLWADFFSRISEQFALMDKIPRFHILGMKRQYFSYLRELFKDEKLISSSLIARSFDDEFDVGRTFSAFADSLKVVESQIEKESQNGYVLLLIDLKKRTVNSKFFSREKNQEAERLYLQAEKSAAEDTKIVLALVSTTAVGGVKEAYPNYFADSTEFLKNFLFVKRAPIQDHRNGTFNLDEAERYAKGVSKETKAILRTKS